MLVQEAFAAFISDITQLALPLGLEDNLLQASPPIHVKDMDGSFQDDLNILENSLNPNTLLYLLLRRNTAVFAITFVPFRAPRDQREKYLHHRHELVKSLGIENFQTSFICKEIGEITDARSWAERDGLEQEDEKEQHKAACRDSNGERANVDVEYKKNKCRLCDRRMKNKITDKATEALKKLQNPGDCVQISLNPDLVLSLDFQTSSLPSELISSRLPATHPTFTFYRHPNKHLYFIFHSPDSASVQQRMKHTMAIPGLVNLHAQDCGVHVDQKIEIHEPGDLVFGEEDERVGRFRSMYLRGGWRGTESRYEALESDGAFYDAVR
ncbi:Twinfilin-1 [Ascochyta clinopodiicola]|nr:Twinfilin-1 [Ascochyta clinopodiicola]